jgi:hypothetical protein
MDHRWWKKMMKLAVEYRVNIMVPRRKKGCHYTFYYCIPLTFRTQKWKCFTETDKRKFTYSYDAYDFPLIYNEGLWPSGCVIARFYRRLNPDRIHSIEGLILPAACPPDSSLHDVVNNESLIADIGTEGESSCPAVLMWMSGRIWGTLSHFVYVFYRNRKYLVTSEESNLNSRTVFALPNLKL